MGMVEVEFHGESFRHNEVERILEVHIREPFYSAGKKFKWLGQSIGLGLCVEALQYALKHQLQIRVKVADGSKWYETSPQTWLNFAHEHNSKMEIGNALIYVIQWSRAYFKTVE